MLTRLKLLTHFEGRQDQLVSGEELARQFLLTRAGVWKHLSALKAIGFPLKSVNRSGYRFQGVPDFSLMTLPKTLGLIPHYALTASSTQIQAKAAAMAGLPEGHVWIAEVQTSGRGRLERRWESAFGGLWFSLLLRPKIRLDQAPPLAIVAAQAIVTMLKKNCSIKATVKHPNDVLVGSKKIAGILTEMSGESDRVRWMVMGIGLNVHNSLSYELSATATSISELTGKSWKRSKLLESFLYYFWPAYNRFPA